MYNLMINDYIDQHFEEMLEFLKGLISINSIRGESKEGKPFGEGPAEALSYAQTFLEKNGFNVKNHENYVLTADLNSLKDELNILAHLDVVPVDNSWTVTEPFVPKCVDGKIYGRGSADDKGPAVAAIFALKAVKDLNLPMSKGVRLILGSDEECGSSDLDYYYKNHEESAMSFTPDANFPVVNTEKARLSSRFTKKCNIISDNTPYISSIEAGSKVNVIPGKASCTIIGISKDEIEKKIEDFSRSKGINMTVAESEEGITISVQGVNGHAAYPENSKNGLQALLSLISQLPLADTDINNSIKALSKYFYFGGYYGDGIGIKMSDEVSGPLTISLTMLSVRDGFIDGSFDCRAPIIANDNTLTEVIRENLAKAGFNMEAEHMEAGHHVPADTPFIQTLLESYEEVFGEKGEPQMTGGGTYVHNLKNGVAFGCEIDGVDNHMHGPDEFMDLEVLRKSAKLFAITIYRLCGER